MKQNIMNN